MNYIIRPATDIEVPLLPDIERAAAVRFNAVGLAQIAAGEPLPLSRLERGRAAGRLFVAALKNIDVPVGFVLLDVVDESAHIVELDVHPAHGRRGLGRRLLHAAIAWAQERGYSAITLTTFRAVPWNAPWYARLGFECLPSSDLTPELAQLVQHETQHGLDPAQRVVMHLTPPQY